MYVSYDNDDDDTAVAIANREHESLPGAQKGQVGGSANPFP